MLTHPLSAANKLRNQVLAVPGTILISQAGHPDKVIRLEYVPEYLKSFHVKPFRGVHIFINMDKGPDQEAWTTAMREVSSTAKRDRPIPLPKSVSQDYHAEWSVSPDEVPLIENGLQVVVAPSPKPQTVVPVPVQPVKSEFQCECSYVAKSQAGLVAHKRHHK